MNRRSIITISAIWMVVGYIFLMIEPFSSSNRDRINYFILMVSYYYVPAIYLWFAYKRKVDLFEPINMFFLLWFLMYTITPLILIIQNNTLCHGIDVMDGCVKATCIYMLSFTALCISYFFRFSFGKRAQNRIVYKAQIYKLDSDEYTEKQRNNIVVIALFGWLTCYLLTLYFLVSTGRGFTYILTLGLAGNRTKATELSIGFLENFSYCMIGFWLYICLSSNNKFLKIILAFLTATAYVIRGFRFVVVIMIVAYLIVHYAKNLRRPRLKQIVSVFLFLLIFNGALGFMRNDLRTGASTDWSNFGFDEIAYALYSNFNVYQIYYGLVNSLPAKHEFGGLQIAIENLSVFIPRILWHGKPETINLLCYRLIAVSVSDYAIYHAAMATPDLGGYYMQFGTLGCILYMVLWGVFCRRIKEKFYNKSYSMHVMIGYAIFVPALLQTIIRGGDLFDIVRKIGFFFIPILVMKFAERMEIINASIGTKKLGQ